MLNQDRLFDVLENHKELREEGRATCSSCIFFAPDEFIDQNLHFGYCSKPDQIDKGGIITISDSCRWHQFQSEV